MADIVAARARYEEAKADVNEMRAEGTMPHATLDYERRMAQALINTVAAWYEERMLAAINDLLVATREGNPYAATGNES